MAKQKRKLERYIAIDTNTYVQCGLLQIEGDDLRTLKDLYKLLRSQRAKLLLPEVVEIEFRKVLKNELNTLKRKIGEHKETINKDKELDEKIKKDMIKGLSECMKHREKNIERVKKETEKLFKNKNTIKKELKIGTDIIIDSYKSFLSGEKPSDKSNVLQADCLIIETLNKYFKGKRNYKLYFCSGNKHDFAKNPDVKNGKYEIHPDISKKFKHIKYYVNLFKLLNKEFKAKYSEESIKKLEEKEEIIKESYSSVGKMAISSIPLSSLSSVCSVCSSNPKRYYCPFCAKDITIELENEFPHLKNILKNTLGISKDTLGVAITSPFFTETLESYIEAKCPYCGKKFNLNNI